MRRSDESLGDEALLESLSEMSRAIAALREAGERLAEDASGDGENGQGEQSAENEGDDPFGRQDGADGGLDTDCLLYTSPSPRDQRGSRMPSSA